MKEKTIYIQLFDGTVKEIRIVEIRKFVHVGYDYQVEDENDNPTVESYLYEDEYYELVKADSTTVKIHRDDIVTPIERKKRR